MAKFLFVDFRPNIPNTKPIKITKGSEKTMFKKGEGDIGFIPKAKNKLGNKPNPTLIPPNTKDTTAFPFGSDLDC